MKTITELREKHALELASAEKEIAIRAELESVPGYMPDNSCICIHADSASVRLWKDFGTDRKLADALAVVQFFADKIVDGEHWNDGCVSTHPPEINSCAKRERSTMDGSHAVEICVHGGKDFGSNVEVKFWVRLAGVLCEISCPVADQHKLVPSVRGNYDKDGQFHGKVEWNWTETQTADKFRKFWSEAPAYRGSYYLADVPNFVAWASTQRRIA